MSKKMVIVIFVFLYSCVNMLTKYNRFFLFVLNEMNLERNINYIIYIRLCIKTKSTLFPYAKVNLREDLQMKL